MPPIQQTLSSSSNKSGQFQSHLSSKPGLTAKSTLAPSQRRLDSVNLSGITVQTPVSRMIKSRVSINQPGHAFDMPSSSIRLRSSTDSVATKQRLLESYNRVKSGLSMR
ncbi:uncharacterized protein LOC108213698 [Daucus carota subsp. sativus]|uniref:uncharacterized protein LOC108213698 n=1 Tax=Daucus carota subsp. sativus TaxID=79200 RepID=UPI003083C924